jgi:putative transposase
MTAGKSGRYFRVAITLDAAFASHPIRFKGLAPKPPVLPTAAWINSPKKEHNY